MFSLGLALFLAYIVGAIPTGYWFCKLLHGIDVTKYGSGNIGATNVARVRGKVFFVPIFLIDAGKASLMLYYCDLFLSKNVCSYSIFITAFFLLFGNAYSVFIGFNGGKGVATSFGILLYLFPVQFSVLLIFLWLGILGITRQVFVASIGAMLSALCLGVLFMNFSNNQTIFLTLIFLWIVFRHKNNIKKYLQ